MRQSLVWPGHRPRKDPVDPIMKLTALPGDLLTLLIHNGVVRPLHGIDADDNDTMGSER